MEKPIKRFASHKNKPITSERAAELRQSGSIVEWTLWRALRDQAKGVGLKIRYQYAFEPYIVDFACPSARLIIEIDGDSHDGAAAYVYDQKRTERFERDGFEVLRYSNQEVMKDPMEVAWSIIEYAIARRNQLFRQTPPRTR